MGPQDPPKWFETRVTAWYTGLVVKLEGSPAPGSAPGPPTDTGLGEEVAFPTQARQPAASAAVELEAGRNMIDLSLLPTTLHRPPHVAI